MHTTGELVSNMNINPIMRELRDTLKLPVYEDRMQQQDKIYLVYNIVSEYGTDYADDYAANEDCKFYLHLFLPLDVSYRTYKKDIKKFLLHHDVAFYQGPTQVETRLRHLVFECTLKGEYSND